MVNFNLYCHRATNSLSLILNQNIVTCLVTRQQLVDFGFGNSMYWTSPVVTTRTIIHFTILHHINQKLVFSVRYHFRLLTLCLPVSLLCLFLFLSSLCKLILSLSLMVRPTVSRRVCLRIKHPSGAYDQIFIIVRQLRVC
jgi:hypothetical protein